jgi:hypothetical protein
MKARKSQVKAPVSSIPGKVPLSVCRWLLLSCRWLWNKLGESWQATVNYHKCNQLIDQLQLLSHPLYLF